MSKAPSGRSTHKTTLRLIHFCGHLVSWLFSPGHHKTVIRALHYNSILFTFNRPGFMATGLICRINNSDRDSRRVLLNEDAAALRRIIAVYIRAVAAPEY